MMRKRTEINEAAERMQKALDTLKPEKEHLRPIIAGALDVLEWVLGNPSDFGKVGIGK